MHHTELLLTSPLLPYISPPRAEICAISVWAEFLARTHLLRCPIHHLLTNTGCCMGVWEQGFCKCDSFFLGLLNQSSPSWRLELHDGTEKLSVLRGKNPPKLWPMSRHLAPNQWIKSLWKVYLPNKAAVCSERSLSEPWSQEARRNGLGRWVKLSLVHLRIYQAVRFFFSSSSSFCQHTFSNLDECSLLWQLKSLAGRARPGAKGEKMRSRALARPLPEPPLNVVQFASGLFFLAKTCWAASAPLDHPAVPDILSSVANSTLKVYICFFYFVLFYFKGMNSWVLNSMKLN